MDSNISPKVLCPTLSVVLVKTIRALCEINIHFDHTLEITGSLHVRSDGDKVLTCLLDEDCIKDQQDAATRMTELASRLSLANAAFAMLPSAVNRPQQMAEALVLSMQGAMDFSNYLMTPQQQQQLQHTDSNNVAMRMVNDDYQHTARMSPISPAQDVCASDLTMNDKKSKDAIYTELYQSAPQPKSRNGVGHRKRVETVAKTLAAIKASNSLNASRADNNSQSNQQNHVKLPDIQTLAHRLPSYENLKSEMDGSHVAHQMVSESSFQQGMMMPQSTTSIAANSTVPGSSYDPLSITIKKEIKEEAGIPRKKFQCMFCGIYLSTKCYLKNHVNAMHTRSRVYQCDLCEHYFYSAGAMRIHKLRNHWQNSKKHRCDQCGESFLLPIELRKHLQKRHLHYPAMPEASDVQNSAIDSMKLEPGEVPSARHGSFIQPGYLALTSTPDVGMSMSSAISLTSQNVNINHSAGNMRE